MAGDALRAVGEAVDFLEAHLDEAPRIEAIARAAGLSPAHFQRVFRAVVGETVGSYARRRRLSRSVDALLETDRRILEIALDAGFESQASYTRAFRQQFGVPPGRFRARGQRAPGLPALTRERLESARRLAAAPPRIVDREACSYVGLKARFLSVLRDGSDNRDVIPALWRRFLELRASLPNAAGDAFGLCFPAPAPEREGELVYMASVRAPWGDPAATPAGDLHHERVPAARCAVFEHRAPAHALPDTILHVLVDWLPDAPYEYAGGVEIDLHPADPSRPLEYWLPIRDAA